MDTREQKALEIAARARITRTSDGWSVPSLSTGGKKYVVHMTDDGSTCSCPDHELTRRPCKHILAVGFVIDRERNGEPAPAPTPSDSASPAAKAVRPKYPQAWASYNAAQTNEKRHVQRLLADLCLTIPEPTAKRRRGRPPIPLRDAIFSACYKVYSGFSARRFATDLTEAHGRGFVGTLPHYNTVLNVLDTADVGPVLTELVRVSSLPLAAVETTFAVDSSGFSTSRFLRWYDEKYGVNREEVDWVRAHVACGTKTNVITAAEVLHKDSSDMKQFPPLMKTTAQGFKIREASADKAYTCTENFQTVEDLGGTLYAPFKSNATGAASPIFAKMFHYFQFNRDDFLKHYHARSNVESTFSMVKRKFGDSVRSKTDTAMKNEVLAKFVCHNLCCVIGAWYELGIAPVFCPEDARDTNPEPVQILRFPSA